MATKYLLLRDTCEDGPDTKIFDTLEERERAKNQLSLDKCDHAYYIDINTETGATDTYIPNFDVGSPEAEMLDESMDGDAQSALVSIGWGNDEDYGDFGGGGDQ